VNRPVDCAPDVREAEEIEGRRLWRVGVTRPAPSVPNANSRVFVGVKRQAILCETLGQHFQDTLRILAILKAENEVVGVPEFPRPLAHGAA